MDEFVVPAELVPDLRRALLRLMGSAAERLAIISLSGELTHLPSYESALWTVQATATLLERIGVRPPEHQRAVSLLPNEYPLLLSRALRWHHELLESRRRDEASYRGASPDVPEDDRLGQLIAELRRRRAGDVHEDEERRLIFPSKTA
jgi:hypothetical protein